MKSFVRLAVLMLFPVIYGHGQKPPETAPAGPQIVRETFDVKKYPALTAVGKLNLIGLRWCSLVLVAEDVGVTAGHCFLKSKIKFDLTKDLDPYLTTVIFRPDGERRIEGVSVKRVLRAKMNPDYAIVRLTKKIPASEIRPLTIATPTFDQLRADESRLGCAGFNGDEGLGNGGLLMTICRKIRIIPETSSAERIDTDCFSTYGGSGGLFFREPADPANEGSVDFIGVVWGMTDEKYDDRGQLVKADDIVTSITPASVFARELNRIIKQR